MLKPKQKLLLGTLTLATFIMVALLPLTVLAQDNCGGVETAVDFGCADGGDDPIASLISAIIRFLTAGVGLVVVVMIIVSGIQYVTSSGNPENTAKAKKKLTNAIIGLLMFIFMAAILNFLVPGGLFDV